MAIGGSGNVKMLISKAGFCPNPGCSLSRNRGFCVIASGSSPKSLGTAVNGTKVNGIHVVEIPYVGNKRTASSVVVTDEMSLHKQMVGRFVEGRLVYRQTFIIRSYEIGPDKTANMETLMNLLQPRWSDMDANQHVNNVKYIGWILESVPMNVLEDYSLTSMTLEYRRECRQSNLLESLTTTTNTRGAKKYATKEAALELEMYTHLLRMQADKAEIVRARTGWQPKIKAFSNY